MSTYPNREALFNAYLSTNEKDWEHVMGKYAVEGTDCPTRLYYLSLDSGLQGDYIIDESYDDKIALASDFYGREVYTIALPQRLLANTDLQGCWNQLFSKAQRCFRNEPDFDISIDLFLYEIDTTDCLIIDNNVLASESIVHNAYINDTHAVFGHPKLKLIQQLAVKNTFGYPDEYCTYYHPFNESKYMQCLLSTPLEILATQSIS